MQYMKTRIKESIGIILQIPKYIQNYKETC